MELRCLLSFDSIIEIIQYFLTITDTSVAAETQDPNGAFFPNVKLSSSDFSTNYNGSNRKGNTPQYTNSELPGTNTNGIYWFGDTSDFSLTALQALRLPKMGVTACLATVTLPGSESLLRRSLEACRVLSKTIETCPTKFGAGIYGIHAEGPIIATYGGLPNSDAISKWTITNFRKLLDNIGKYLRIMTISPSLETGSYVHKKSQDEEKEDSKE